MTNTRLERYVLLLACAAVVSLRHGTDAAGIAILSGVFVDRVSGMTTFTLVTKTANDPR